MRKLTYFNGGVLFLLLFAVACKKDLPAVEAEQPANAYISKIFEYKPAPGQLINDPSYGTLARANALIGGADNGLVSLGAFGGYIIFGFDHEIKNEQGNDLGIFGNPLLGVGMEWSEPGIVCVMKDVNKNGLPDDGEWYELAGSEYDKNSTTKHYKITYQKPVGNEDITWEDNQGVSGVVLRNTFHSQAYFPSWIPENSLTFEGTLVKSTLTDGGIISNKALDFGYADNGSTDYLSSQATIGKGYNGFDIDWARDKNGNKIPLSAIDFVKVYTAQNSNGNPNHPITTNPSARVMGDVSTEIGGAVDLKLYKR